MNIDLAKCELELLLKLKNEKELAGRNTDYEDINRIAKLRNFLDVIDVPITDIKKEKNNELPF